MNIRMKFITVMLITSLFITLGIYFISHYLFERNTIDAENREIEKNLDRIDIFLKEVFSNMEMTVNDWAIWDDTYYFIKDNTPDYINSNLNYESLRNININFMIFIDKKPIIFII